MTKLDLTIFTEKNRILLVDGHALFREGLRRMLELDEGLRVVAEADSATAALKHLKSTKIDIAIVDLNITDCDGLKLVEKIRSQWTELPILILSTEQKCPEVLEALSKGANGYLAKTVEREELLCAIRTVVRGGTHLCAAAAVPVLEWLSQFKGETPPPLDERERTILQMVVEGKNNSEIAKSVWLSVSRVKFHLSTLFRKFEVSDRTSLAVEAARRGAIRAPSS